MGDADTVATSFEYWESDDRSTTGEVVAAAELSDPGTFSRQITGLSAATEYVFIAQGSTENDISVQGNCRTFTTDATLQVVSNDATNIQRDSATLNGEVTSLGGADSVEAYFRYWEQGNEASTATLTAASTISAPGAFDIKVTGLAPDTSYFFTARAKASDGDRTKGSEVEFST